MAAIDCAGGASLGHDHFHEQRKSRLELLPDPDGNVFAGRIFKAVNFVQVVMIELFPDGAEPSRDLGVVHQPAQLGVTLTGHDNFHLKAVAVQPAAFMRGGQMRQQMRGFKLK